MGTSTRHSSPRTVPWRAVEVGYSGSHSPERLATLVWRASATNPETDLSQLLTTPVVGGGLESVGAVGASTEAARELVRKAISRGEVGIAVEIAKRAAVQSFGAKDPKQAYAQNVFAEATNYLVSRDIPGLIAPQGRLNSVGAVNNLRQSIVSVVRKKVADIAAEDYPSSSKDWGSFVQSVAQSIRGDV